ncbi:MAG: hypothetical protein JJE21_09930 [Spirochaetaceae bacterium]|nr:hypothetical protein [Spirochaetaceae bacterium]
MINQNSIKLSLFQPLVYNKLTITDNTNIDVIYSSLIKKLDAAPIGCEAVIAFNYAINDGISINVISVGFANEPTEEVRVAIEQGEEIPLSEHDMEIESGKYEFIQLPILPEKDALYSTFIPFIYSSSYQKIGTFHFRLLKENALVILSQVILKLEE